MASCAQYLVAVVACFVAVKGETVDSAKICNNNSWTYCTWFWKKKRQGFLNSASFHEKQPKKRQHFCFWVLHGRLEENMLLLEDFKWEQGKGGCPVEQLQKSFNFFHREIENPILIVSTRTTRKANLFSSYDWKKNLFVTTGESLNLSNFNFLNLNFSNRTTGSKNL